MITCTSINNPCMKVISSSINYFSRKDRMLEVNRITCNSIGGTSHRISNMKFLTFRGLLSRDTGIDEAESVTPARALP